MVCINVSVANIRDVAWYASRRFLAPREGGTRATYGNGSSAEEFLHSAIPIMLLNLRRANDLAVRSAAAMLAQRLAQGLAILATLPLRKAVHLRPPREEGAGGSRGALGGGRQLPRAQPPRIRAVRFF